MMTQDLTSDDLRLSLEGRLPDEAEEGANENEEDFYSSQPGEAISVQKASRRRKILWGISFVLVGLVLISIGVAIGTSRANRANNARTASNSQNKSPGATPSASAPGSPPAGPAQSKLFTFLSSLIGQTKLQNATGAPYQAYTWLSADPSLDNYVDSTIKQRFALACLYYATNYNHTWYDTNGWLEFQTECSWLGVECDKEYNLIGLNLTDSGLEGLVPPEISILSDTLLSLGLARNALYNKNEELEFLGQLTRLRK